MILKNPEKILHQPVPSKGSIWFVNDVSVTMDDDISYIFDLVTQVPVKSSPNQQYYHMTKAINEKATLRLFKSGYQIDVYELICNGQALRGYCKDIDTMDKFISVLGNQLPNY